MLAGYHTSANGPGKQDVQGTKSIGVYLMAKRDFTEPLQTYTLALLFSFCYVFCK